MVNTQVFDHEATMRLMAGANPARCIQRHRGSAVRNRRRQPSAAGNHKTINDCLNVMTRLTDTNTASYWVNFRL